MYPFLDSSGTAREGDHRNETKDESEEASISPGGKSRDQQEDVMIAQSTQGMSTECCRYTGRPRGGTHCLVCLTPAQTFSRPRDPWECVRYCVFSFLVTWHWLWMRMPHSNTQNYISVSQSPFRLSVSQPYTKGKYYFLSSKPDPSIGHIPPLDKQEYFLLLRGTGYDIWPRKKTHLGHWVSEERKQLPTGNASRS